MSLRQISLNNFRNLKPVTLDFHSRHNIIYGANASGKTSLLEAINFICEGRSFKSHFPDQCIHHDHNDFLLFGRFTDHKVGYSRSNKRSIIRINNETIHQVSLLAKKTPVRIFDSSSFDLITGSPKGRRSYIDWYLFHVEQSYAKLWSDHRHALKQRNALLKQKKNIDQLDYWDDLIEGYCLKIFKLRKELIVRVNKTIFERLNVMLEDMEVDIEYKAGWDINYPLLDQLKSKRERDIKYGFTSVGTHRDELLITNSGVPATQILSRGQLKRLSMTLFLAQILLMSDYSQINTVVLIDDLSAELDPHNVKVLLKNLDKLDVQIFITSIQPDSLLLQHFQEYRLFHVEHGMIKPVRNS